MEQRTAFAEPFQVLTEGIDQGIPRVLHGHFAGAVGGYQQVFCVPGRVILGDGLGAEHVQGRAGNLSFVQGLDQGILAHLDVVGIV